MQLPPSPLLGEPLAVEFANTRFIHRDSEHDALSDPGQLAEWLRRVSDRLPLAPSEQELDAVGPGELTRARELRDALRTLLQAAAGEASFDAGSVEILNRAVRNAPQWPELSLEPLPQTVQRSATSGIDAALGSIAREAIELLGDDRRRRVRACAAPGCVLYFVKDHPRRACCSARCSNRMRSARHYARHGRRPR